MVTVWPRFLMPCSTLRCLPRALRIETSVLWLGKQSRARLNFWARWTMAWRQHVVCKAPGRGMVWYKPGTSMTDTIHKISWSRFHKFFDSHSILPGCVFISRQSCVRRTSAPSFQLAVTLLRYVCAGYASHALVMKTEHMVRLAGWRAPGSVPGASLGCVWAFGLDFCVAYASLGCVLVLLLGWTIDAYQIVGITKKLKIYKIDISCLICKFSFSSHTIINNQIFE